MAVQHRKQDVAVVADRDTDQGIGRAGREPVAPTNREARVVTERAPGVDILATGDRQHGAEFGQREGAEQRVDPSDDPDTEEPEGTGQLFGDIAGGPQDADADRVPDDDGEPEGNAQDLKKVAPRGGGGGGGLLGRRAQP